MPHDPHPTVRTCPFCAEEIKWEAVKCKHCGEDLSKLHADEKHAATKKRDRKVLVIVLLVFLGLLLLVANPALAIFIFILGGIGWYLYRRPSARTKLAQSAKQGNKKFWPLVMRYKLQIGVVVVLMLVARGAYGMFAPATPIITIKDSYPFTGNNVTVTGQVMAHCRCEVTAALNGQALTLQSDGTFSANFPVSATEDTGNIEVKATAKPLHLSSSVKDATATSTYNRQPTPIDVVNPPTEWNTAKLTLALHGSPNATVTVKEAPSVKVTLDSNGDGSAVVPFSTVYNAETNPFTVLAKVDGYAEGTKQVSVKNQKYDSARVAKEEDAKKLKEMAAKAKQDMETYSGNGDVQLAVGGEIDEHRCISYSCANSGWKYITLVALVRNAGNDVIYVNPNDFTLQDTDGQTFTYESETFSYQHPFDAVSLQPGGKSGGVLVFIVPKDSKVFTLIYAGHNGSVAKPILIQ